MPPPLLFSLDGIDLEATAFDLEAIRSLNPHRHEMEQLTRIAHVDTDAGRIVAIREVGEDEFWVRGHIPGRPLFPGVLMIEAAAQMCSAYFKLVQKDDRFLGFGGVDNVKFRGQVVPGDRLVLLGRAESVRNRRAVFETQGLVDGRQVVEARITGMPL